jgi:hypothetical protein
MYSGQPVPVGSIIELSTAVVYSMDGFIVVQVDAGIVSALDGYGQRIKTNKLSYVFE